MSSIQEILPESEILGGETPDLVKQADKPETSSETQQSNEAADTPVDDSESSDVEDTLAAMDRELQKDIEMCDSLLPIHVCSDMDLQRITCFRLY